MREEATHEEKTKLQSRNQQQQQQMRRRVGIVDYSFVTERNEKKIATIIYTIIMTVQRKTT